MSILNYMKKVLATDTSEAKQVDVAATNLYKELQSSKYRTYPCETKSLGEGMDIVNEVICGYWKPRFLVDHNVKTAVEFMNKSEKLVTVKPEDIDWESLTHLEEVVVDRARKLDFGFPSFVYLYENGIAEVSWQLNPDGMYYMDEDGYGMTDDQEVTIWGAIDRQGHVVTKFHAKNK